MLEYYAWDPSLLFLFSYAFFFEVASLTGAIKETIKGIMHEVDLPGYKNLLVDHNTWIIALLRQRFNLVRTKK